MFEVHNITEALLVKVTNDLLMVVVNGFAFTLALLEISAVFETIDLKILLRETGHWD